MKKAFLISIAVLAPASALAAQGLSNIQEAVNFVVDLINLAIPVVGGLALLAFFWGLLKFISKSGDPKGNSDGRKLMIWGVVALFIMLGFKGIIVIAQSQLGIRGTTVLPYIKPSQQ